MPEIGREEIEDMVQKYKAKIATNLEAPEAAIESELKPITTAEYQKFRNQYMPRNLNLYELGCQQAEKLINMKPDKKKEAAYLEAIETTHLNITPGGAVSFAMLMPFVVIIIGSFLSYLMFQSMFFVMFFMIVGISMMGPLNKLPITLAERWRMRASNQMVLCIFYIVTYMRHTSNLELAIDFAADHISAPLNLDLKKVLWNVETEKYPTIKDSLDAYLETWKNYNLEFVESVHLIESSLFETSEERRLDLLDKSLAVILDETYEKMLHYAQNLKGPITMLHMMGVILPILGLVILPLVVSFMDSVKWFHIAAMYNLGLPAFVFYLGSSILAKRPSGYGDVDISENNPELKKYKNLILKFGDTEVKITPKIISIGVAIFFMVVALFPLYAPFFNPNIRTDVSAPNHYDISLREGQFEMFGYRNGRSGSNVGKIVGPFGLGSTLLSLAFPLGIGLGIGLYYKLRSQNIIKIRENAKKLEQEFASALFQLGNRLGDGLPAEIAFSRVAETIQGTISGQFFLEVANNITRMGMSVNQAIFDPNVGALVKYPSDLIESSMKVLVESSKKGPRIAAQALINVSRYIKEMHRVDERLKDLMSEIVSSMNSQIKFLGPAISGIVIGITSMVTTILGKLGAQMSGLTAEGGGEAGAGAAAGLLGMFGDGIPTFYFQIVIGLYIVEICIILTILVNGIENGVDKLNQEYLLGQNLVKSTTLYCMIAGVIIIAFNFIAGAILASKAGG